MYTQIHDIHMNKNIYTYKNNIYELNIGQERVL